jgi:hypothetical protein
MTDIYEHALALLGRCERWVELRRDKGVVTLQGLRQGRVVNEAFSESVLLTLLTEGKAKCEASERIALTENFLQPRPIEVQQKYWSVVK